MVVWCGVVWGGMGSGQVGWGVEVWCGVWYTHRDVRLQTVFNRDTE